MVDKSMICCICGPGQAEKVIAIFAICDVFMPVIAHYDTYMYTLKSGNFCADNDEQ